MESLASPGRRTNGKQAAFIRDSGDGVESLHVVGEIDLANADEFEVAIMGMARTTKPVIIDLTCCTYIDSCALRVLSGTSKQLRYTVVAGANSATRRVFEITKASTFLSIEYKDILTLDLSEESPIPA